MEKKIFKPSLESLGRPTFYYNDNLNMQIRAGGVIIYRFEKDKIQFLMIKKLINNTYEDIGGKTDIIDISELDTISREVEEETNLIINSLIIKNQCMKSKSKYIPNSKYLLFLVKGNIYEKRLKSEYFGNLEIKDNINRIIEWVNLSDILEYKIKLHPRISGKEFREFICNEFNL
jgi:8-oxo-dGTP pyrophosphatase MutT (NUDIX family)